MANDHKFGHKVHDDLKENLCLEMNQPRKGHVLLHSADLRHCYETYSALTKDLPREKVQLLNEILELEPEKPRPVSPADNLGVDTSLDPTFTDITKPEKKLSMALDKSEEDIQ